MHGLRHGLEVRVRPAGESMSWSALAKQGPLVSNFDPDHYVYLMMHLHLQRCAHDECLHMCKHSSQHDMGPNTLHLWC